MQIDRYVRRNTVDRFGPVREVVHEADQGLVLEVAFEGLQRSTRHKSGVAMRFPRISRLRWDKPPRRGRPAGDAGEDAGAESKAARQPSRALSRSAHRQPCYDCRTKKDWRIRWPRRACTAFFGGPPLSVLFRLVLLSILVGVILTVLGLDPWNILEQPRDVRARDLEHGLRRGALAVALFPARRRDRVADLADRAPRQRAAGTVARKSFAISASFRRAKREPNQSPVIRVMSTGVTDSARPAGRPE